MTRRRLPLVSPFGPPAVVDAVQRTTVEALAASRTAEAAIALAVDATSWAEEATRAVKERIPPSREQACAAGCAYCCHVKVLVTAPEALAVAALLRDKLSPAELDRVRARVVATNRKTRGMSTELRARAKIPCPLLEDSRCLAYEARPVACWGANSFDAAACAQGFEHPEQDVGIPIYKPQGQIADAVRSGLANGLGESGLDAQLLELDAALAIALGQPAAGREWARGRPTFAPAHDREFAALLGAQDEEKARRR